MMMLLLDGEVRWWLHFLYDRFTGSGKCWFKIVYSTFNICTGCIWLPSGLIYSLGLYLLYLNVLSSSPPNMYFNLTSLCNLTNALANYILSGLANLRQNFMLSPRSVPIPSGSFWTKQRLWWAVFVIWLKYIFVDISPKTHFILPQTESRGLAMKPKMSGFLWLWLVSLSVQLLVGVVQMLLGECICWWSWIMIWRVWNGVLFYKTSSSPSSEGCYPTASSSPSPWVSSISLVIRMMVPGRGVRVGLVLILLLQTR